MMSRIFGAIGGLAVFFIGAANFFNWGADDSEKVTGVPRSVRDNPGVYRTHYVGGK